MVALKHTYSECLDLGLERLGLRPEINLVLHRSRGKILEGLSFVSDLKSKVLVSDLNTSFTSLVCNSFSGLSLG